MLKNYVLSHLWLPIRSSYSESKEEEYVFLQTHQMFCDSSQLYSNITSFRQIPPTNKPIILVNLPRNNKQLIRLKGLKLEIEIEQNLKRTLANPLSPAPQEPKINKPRPMPNNPVQLPIIQQTRNNSWNKMYKSRIYLCSIRGIVSDGTIVIIIHEIYCFIT